MHTYRRQESKFAKNGFCGFHILNLDTKYKGNENMSMLQQSIYEEVC